MSLIETQQLFAQLMGGLLTYIYAQGWAVTFGDFNRPDGHGHMADSLHYIRLAADLNLFVGGVYQTGDCPEWQQIGLFWTGLHYLARWGGNFEAKDCNHFSLEWEGRA